jgi:hypothetical protein
MADYKGRNKKRKDQKKIERLKRLLGIDLCACSGGHKLLCHGICRELHVSSGTGKVECISVYQIDRSVVKSSGQHKQKRTWKYYHQKDVNENKQAKDQRREKRERDQS